MIFSRNIPSRQQGSSLLTVLVVLLVLSLMAIASFDSSNLQSIMTRNSQLRLETFNTAKVELEAQLDSYLNVAAGTLDAGILQLIDTPLSENIAAPKPSLNSDDNPLVVQERSVIVGFDKVIDLVKDGFCPTYGSDVDSGAAATTKPQRRCRSFVVGANSTVNGLNIVSDQKQTFELFSF